MKDNIALIAVSIVAAALIISFVNPTQPATMSVTGDGEVYGAPDTATMAFYADALAPTADAAKQEADAKNSAIIAALIGQGIRREDIQTTSYSVNEEERYDENTTSYVSLGYRVRIEAQVKSKVVDEVGSLIDTIVANGGEMTGSIWFTIEDDTAIKAQALTEAVADAKSKAQTTATQAGIKLGRIQSITPTYNSYPIYRDYAAYSPKAEMGGASISPGQEQVTAYVSIVYELS